MGKIMTIIDYDDIVQWHSSVTDIESMALKQLAKGKFKSYDDYIETEVENEGERIKIRFHDTDAISCYNFRSRVYTAHPHEPCTEYLYNETALYDGKSLIEMLNEYKAANIKKGADLSNEVWFKLYSKQKLEHGMRDVYHATWIDYEAQLMHSDVIFDENHLYGLWAMPFSTLLDNFNEESMEHYGRSLFIVKPVPDVDYLLDGKEVIGDKYLVISKLDPSKIEDIGVLVKKLLEIKSSIYEEKLDSQHEELVSERSQNIALINQLESMKNLIPQLRWRIILCICLSFVMGLLLSLLF